MRLHYRVMCCVRDTRASKASASKRNKLTQYVLLSFFFRPRFVFYFIFEEEVGFPWKFRRFPIQAEKISLCRTTGANTKYNKRSKNANHPTNITNITPNRGYAAKKKKSFPFLCFRQWRSGSSLKEISPWHNWISTFFCLLCFPELHIWPLHT